MHNVSLLRTLAVAGIVAMTIASPALAKGDLQKQRRAAQDQAYWQGKMSDNTAAAQRQSQGGNSPEAKYQGGVSQYPCAHCVYDNARGGYVFSPSRK
jgi:hypothetical protein